jgi:hypothetical protein
LDSNGLGEREAVGRRPAQFIGAILAKRRLFSGSATTACESAATKWASSPLTKCWSTTRA